MKTPRTLNQPYKGQRVSVLGSQKAENQDGIVRMWRGMNPLQKAAFAALGPTIPDWNGKRHARPLSAYQAFQSLSYSRIAANLSVTILAPPRVELPPSLPPLTLTASANSSGTTLFLTPQTDYPFPCQIWAAVPQMPTTASVPVNKFAAIVSVSTLPASGIALQPAFFARLGPFQAGHKIFVRVCPLSLTGFRGQTLPLETYVQQALSLPDNSEV